MIYNGYIYSTDGESRVLIGEIEGVNIKTNIPEIESTPCEFIGECRYDLIIEMQRYLKHRDKTGVLQIVN